MLTSLTLIRSCTYDLAELDFRRGNSMQLVGGNNIGKSSLIYTLNFLFVINRKRMSFMGKKLADKTTMEYYFPEAEGSFLVFEISKRGRTYCMLVWRDGEGNPNYGRLFQAYRRDLFLEEATDGSLTPLKLTALRKRWALSGIDFKDLRHQREVFKTVYHTGRANDAAVWLRNSGHGSAAAGFSKLYRYLIDTRLIDMPALREILLLADHREDRQLQYGKSNLADVDRLRKLQGRVETLRHVKADFETFRTNYQQLSADTERLTDLALHFNYHALILRSQIEEAKGRHNRELQETTDQLRIAEALQTEANRTVGANGAERRQGQQEATRIESQLTEIAALPDAAFLRQGIQNLRDEIDAIRLRLTELKATTESVADLEGRLERNARQLTERRAQRANVENWLVLHLAKDDTDRRRLSAILHKDIARSNAGGLRKAVSATHNLTQIFDGSFELPPDLKLPELDSPEALEAEIAELSRTHVATERLMETARNRAAVEEQLLQKEQQLQDQNRQLQLRESGPDRERELAKVRKSIVEIENRYAKAEREARIHAETVTRIRKALQILQRQREERERQSGKIHTQLRKLEDFHIATEGLEYAARPLAGDDLDVVFSALEECYQEVRLLRADNKNLFRRLREQLLSELASEEAFIEEVATEYAGIELQAASIDSLVNNISQRFASPAADLLNEYQKFRDFISKQFNRGLARQQVSNIEQLRIELVDNDSLQADLHKISGLDLGGNLFRHDGGGMKILKRYIEQGRAITFSDLFTLQLKLTVNGKEKTVDLSKQIESDGTDRMLRLVIVMQVISRLAELGPENRVVVFIDEIATIDGKNRPQLVRFCAENHFYPIFAAPEMVEGFDRYVMISRAANGSLIVDGNKHYIDAERD